MSKPKPTATQAPFQNNTTNTFGYQSFDPNNPFVRDYLDYDLDFEPDPGVEQRTQLAQQASQNRWNSAFAGGVPQQVRMMNQAAEERDIANQGSADRRAANYAANYQKQVAELARRERLLPQLVQTGGSSSGFNTQITPPTGGGFFSGGFGSLIGGGVTAGIAL